jgi:hypothetical protein
MRSAFDLPASPALLFLRARAANHALLIFIITARPFLYACDLIYGVYLISIAHHE